MEATVTPTGDGLASPITTPAPTRRLAGRVDALDGLRGVLLIIVILFHSGHLSGGFMGLDVFFVMSGYLITLLLLDDHVVRGRARLGPFWDRRGRRIFPCLILAVGGTLLLTGLIHTWEDVSQNLEQAILSVLSVSNFYEMTSPKAGLTMYQHTWSLAVEAQFYLVFPVIAFVVLGRLGRPSRAAAAPRIKLLLVLCLAGALASVIAMISIYENLNDLARVYYGTDTRIAPILLGSALACATAIWGFAQGWARVLLEVLGIIGAVAFGACVLFLTRPTDALWNGGYALAFLACLALTAAVAHPVRGPLSRALSFKPLVLLGVVSYGVYLWHWPLFFILSPDKLHLTGWPLLGVQVAISIAIATLSYVFIESPIRRRRWPFTKGALPRRRTAPAAPPAAQPVST